MKQCLFILLFITAFCISTNAQGRRDGDGGRGGFSLAGKYAARQIDSSLQVSDSILQTSRRVNAYHLSLLGDRIEAPMDTNRLNTANSTLMEGKSTALAYTGNIASPSQSRIFFERNEARDFIFADAYDPFLITPQNARFYDTKVPYSRILYTRSGRSEKQEEQFNAFLTSNFGQKINIGADFDYIYSRGHYNSNGNKLINFRFFANYRSDRYEAYAHFRNFNMVNSENGGMTEDRYITHPDDMTDGNRKRDSRAFPTRFSNVWNRVRSKNIFLTHRYNLGFYRDMTANEPDEKRKGDEQKLQSEPLTSETIDEKDTGELPDKTEEEEEREEAERIHENGVFIPVSSIVHTFEYDDYRRRFISDNTGEIDAYYTRYLSPDSSLNDETSAWMMKNTVALSLREGFHDWAKFGLSAFIRFENRSFDLIDKVKQVDSEDTITTGRTYRETSTYIGGELTKRRGNVLTYQGRGEFCPVGDDQGEVRLSGDIQTKFRLTGKEARIQAGGYIKNITPAFYLRHNHSRYFWWDHEKKTSGEFKKINRVYLGGSVSVEQTHTQLTAGVENIKNYVYFDTTGIPAQQSKNIQVIAARLKQNFYYKVLGWENEIVYQKSSNESVLPLPAFSAYSNLYLTFKYAKVLTIQLGANVYYHSLYYTPCYDPATQQFINQKRKKTGDYPLVNAYANFHLKQARFFIMAYNLSSILTDHPAYFSMPGYPLNPMVFKLGVSVYFNN
ncbi:MAG: putative porin [Tannerella sp.]|jgi:hypothetical protein|nr:putative porin [Tannerella sp.]